MRGSAVAGAPPSRLPDVAPDSSVAARPSPHRHHYSCACCVHQVDMALNTPALCARRYPAYPFWKGNAFSTDICAGAPYRKTSRCGAFSREVPYLHQKPARHPPPPRPLVVHAALHALHPHPTPPHPTPPHPTPPHPTPPHPTPPQLLRRLWRPTVRQGQARLQAARHAGRRSFPRLVCYSPWCGHGQRGAIILHLDSQSLMAAERRFPVLQPHPHCPQVGIVSFAHDCGTLSPSEWGAFSW